MIYSNLYGKPRQASSSWFSNCCGATYTRTAPKRGVRSAFKGIRVLDHKVGNEFDNGKVMCKHVETKNGNLTFLVQHTW